MLPGRLTLWLVAAALVGVTRSASTGAAMPRLRRDLHPELSTVHVRDAPRPASGLRGADVRVEVVRRRERDGRAILLRPADSGHALDRARSSVRLLRFQDRLHAVDG